MSEECTGPAKLLIKKEDIYTVKKDEIHSKKYKNSEEPYAVMEERSHSNNCNFTNQYGRPNYKDDISNNE